MRATKIVKTFRLDDGELATLRYPRFSDWPDMLSEANALFREKKSFIFSRRKMNRKQARKWVRQILLAVRKRQAVSLSVEIRGRVVGGAGVWKSEYAPGRGELGIGFRSKMPYTGEKLWGRGIGTKLLRAILREAKKVLKIKVVRLNAFVANHRALALYRKFGFKEICRLRREKICHGVMRDRIYMKKHVG